MQFSLRLQTKQKENKTTVDKLTFHTVVYRQVKEGDTIFRFLIITKTRILQQKSNDMKT